MRQPSRQSVNADCRRTALQPGPTFGPTIARPCWTETVKTGFHIGPTVTILTLLTYYGAMLFEGRSRAARAVSTGVFFLLSALFYPFKYLDRFLRNKRSAHRLAFGVFCTSRKASASASG
jgi:hypothetical protein